VGGAVVSHPDYLDGHGGDPDADPAADDSDHPHDRLYRELVDELIDRAPPDVDR